MPVFPNITPLFLDYIIGLLVPLFRTAAGGDEAAACHTAKCLLASYDVETEDEMRLAAAIASFSFGALDALSKSMDPDLSLNAMLRLRGSANAQHRSAHQCERRLDKLRKERRSLTTGIETELPAPEPPTNQTCVPSASQPGPVQPRTEITVSRQQRRAIERTVAKAQRHQTEQTRRDAMRAMRTTAIPALLATIPSPAGAQHLAAQR
jgi:hypothetical protein